MSAATAAPAVWDVPGQDRAVAVLRGAASRGEVGHAWAFLGPPGVGQQRAARSMAAALNCRVALGKACGACPDCDRCLRGVSTQLDEFWPTGPAHRVADVRDRWLRAAAMVVEPGQWKLLRIIDADRMNEAAANAFLKGLEEPAARTTWVLEIADPEELPDTILSRCRVLRFVPWGRAQLDAQALDLGLDDDDGRALAVRASLGIPAALARIAGDRGLDDLRLHRSLPTVLREAGPGQPLVAAKALEAEVARRSTAVKAEGKAAQAALTATYGDAVPRTLVRQVEERTARQERDVRLVTIQGALDDLLGWYRDCLLVTAGGDVAKAIHADAAEALRADAAALGPANLLHAAELVLAVREDLELNVGQGLALESMFLKLAALTRQS